MPALRDHDTIKQLAIQVEHILIQLAKLEKRPAPDVKLESRARGTGDVTEQAAIAVKAANLTVPERVEAALRVEPMTLAELVEATNVSRPKVAAAMQAFREAGKIYNLGEPGGDGRWLWIIGDQTATAELQAKVEQIIGIVPMTFPALLVATGARHGRVSGCIVKLQRARRPVMNLGNGRKARWFLPNDAALEAMLRERALPPVR
jgi:hypothetical protein